VVTGSASEAAADDGGVRLIVGIGNPGSDYDRTRHNVGFAVVDRLVHRAALGAGRTRWQAELWSYPQDGQGSPALLMKPLTFVNASGPAVQAAMAYHRIPAERVLVVVDDLHLGLGQLRLRTQGSAGGHNGLRSIAQCIGDSYHRLRLGIGAPPAAEQQVAYVLGRFAAAELPLVERMVEGAAAVVMTWLRTGLAAAQQEVGQRSAPVRPAPINAATGKAEGVPPAAPPQPPSG
jgi:PTH1 family peptidyl-tRNA hydrolase